MDYQTHLGVVDKFLDSQQLDLGFSGWNLLLCEPLGKGKQSRDLQRALGLWQRGEVGCPALHPLASVRLFSSGFRGSDPSVTGQAAEETWETMPSFFLPFSYVICQCLWALTVTANCKSANLKFPTEKSYLKLLILMCFRVKSMEWISSPFVDKSTLLNSSSFALYVTISCHGLLSRIWQKCFLLLQLSYW